MLSTANSKPHSESSRHINERRRPELKPTSARRKQKMRRISENSRPISVRRKLGLRLISERRKSELRQRLKHFSGRSKSAVKWRRSWKLTACVESWPRKKPKNASRG